jgi:hypothetical protein
MQHLPNGKGPQIFHEDSIWATPDTVRFLSVFHGIALPHICKSNSTTVFEI